MGTGGAAGLAARSGASGTVGNLMDNVAGATAGSAPMSLGSLMSPSQMALLGSGQALSQIGKLMPGLAGGKMPIMTNMPQINVGPNLTPTPMNGANPGMLPQQQQRTVSQPFSNLANQATGQGGQIAAPMGSKALAPVAQPKFNPQLASQPPIPFMPARTNMALMGQQSPAQPQNQGINKTVYGTSPGQYNFQYNTASGAVQQQKPGGQFTANPNMRFDPSSGYMQMNINGKWADLYPVA